MEGRPQLLPEWTTVITTRVCRLGEGAYIDAPTETPTVGSTEVWKIFNLTGDTHPIHFHLVNVQIIQRAAIYWDPRPASP